MRDQNGPIAKLICSGDKSNEIVEDVNNQIHDRAVDGYNFTDEGKLQLILKDGTVVDLKNDKSDAVCFIGE